MSAMADRLSSEQVTILAVDDDSDALFALEALLAGAGYRVLTAPNGKAALKLADQDNPDIIIMDVMMPEMNGFEAAAEFKADPVLKYIPLILLTSRDDLDAILTGLNAGADDYLIKPFKKEELLARVKATLRMRKLYKELRSSQNNNEKLRTRLNEQYNFGNIVGSSSAMQAIFELIDKVKDADAPVLIQGESGTGKELVANALHLHGSRKAGPFVVQNCAALNDQLLESELFGHVKGAFTGALKNKPGLFEVADGGTFFLDELGEMSPGLQVKLLRVLQDGSFTPVGGTVQQRVDVRIIAATHRNLREQVKIGAFREDLYYRLNVVNIQLPPLRERASDIALLTEHALQKFSQKNGRSKKSLSDDTLAYLESYHWPGNIRELQNEIERLVILSGANETISADLLSPHIRQANPENARGRRVEGKLKDALDHLERNMILEALQRLDGNKSEAARVLGISRSNLIAKIQTYKLEE